MKCLVIEKTITRRYNKTCELFFKVYDIKRKFERDNEMKTPKLYNDLINEKKITNEIIAECVYSANKRAKNYRDKIKEYKNGRFHQHLESNIEKA